MGKAGIGIVGAGFATGFHAAACRGGRGRPGRGLPPGTASRALLGDPAITVIAVCVPNARRTEPVKSRDRQRWRQPYQIDERALLSMEDVAQ